VLIKKVTVSSDLRVVIPAEIRNALSIRKGQTIMVVLEGKTLTMVPVPNIADMEGAFPGMSSEGIREEEDRF
jgi:AbrB family looped-hinge helix DNA binding protein